MAKKRIIIESDDDQEMRDLMAQARELAGIFSRMTVDDQDRVIMPKKDLEMLRMSGKLLGKKAKANPGLN